MNRNKLEIASFNYESAILASTLGVDRIEFCLDKDAGGLSPNLDQTIKLINTISTPVNIMIRPRGGDFCYSDQEFEQMKVELLQFKDQGVNGFVFGILSKEQTVDIMRNKILVQLASPLPCTFHRAFDLVNNYEQALADVIGCGFQTILTSGQRNSALEGMSFLKKLTSLAETQIDIMPGGGIRSENILQLKEQLNCTFYHSAATKSLSDEADALEICALLSKLYS